MTIRSHRYPPPTATAAVASPAQDGPVGRSAARTTWLSWPLVVSVLAFVLVLAAAPSLSADPDTLWHLATGHWIVEHGRVPSTDPFSHTMNGSRWVAFEWLSEVILHVIRSTWGWAGLAVAAATSFAATLGYLTRFLMARLKPVYALLLVFLSAAMLYQHLLARPHVFGWVLLAVWSGTLVAAVEADRGPPWWALGLLALWANMHGSFTLGTLLGLVLATEAVLAAPAERRRTALVSWGGFAFLLPVAGLLTPTGWDGLIYPLQIMNMSTALDVIAEWQSPNFRSLQPLEIWLLVMVSVAATGRLRLPWTRLLLVLALLHQALAHQRDVSVLGLLSPLLIASALGRSAAAADPAEGHQAVALNAFFERGAAPARRSALAGATLLVAAVAAATVHAGGFAPSPAYAPEAALQAARNAGAHGPVLNAYAFGGYLIYEGVPVFIDGRADMYGDAFLARQMRALDLADDDELTGLLDEYRIGWTLLEPGTPATAQLDRLPGWRRVYADDIAVVHVHDPPAPTTTR